MKYLDLLQAIAHHDPIPNKVTFMGMEFKLAVDDYGSVIDYISPEYCYLSERIALHTLEGIAKAVVECSPDTVCPWHVSC